MFTLSTILAVFGAIFGVGFMIYANITIFDRKDLPTLQKVMIGFDIFVIVGCLALITINGWWC